ncbi:MAG: type I methionyl aminopeptidase [Alphaproteobacteria bacterium]|uniref:Methionine aminopeptidase n=1 Tax=Candidatus Nitrobium versatile TaxID=2884831 RepID=A0A953M3J3_9BACT|nr:type I methionyl aminopeptidase [Candidatus Nitrobium versatile]
MVIIKSQAEISKIAAAGRIVAQVLQELKSFVKVGITTAEIDAFAEKKVRQQNAVPAFKGYRGYPASTCTSVNEQVVHGIPSPSVRLRSGDLISIDLGVILDGFYGDGAITLPVGEVDDEARRLIRVTEESLYLGIEAAVVGNRVSDISAAIQRHVEANGFSVVRAFVGHGVGHYLHEDPQIPNFGKPGHGQRLQAGMTLAIEPMVNEGTHEVNLLEDGWTAVTVDGSRSAHFEHTIVLTKSGPRILTKL